MLKIWEFIYIMVPIVAVILTIQLIYRKKNQPLKPHKHDWKFKHSVGPYWDSWKYHTCFCGAEAVEAKGVIKITKRGDPKYWEPHEHDWKFEYRTGGGFTDNPVSLVFSCECGKMAVRHTNEDGAPIHILS